MNISPDFTGRVALVTGASRGIGRATALRLAAAGADVAVNYLHSAAEAEATVGMLRSIGVRALAVRADVADRAAVEEMFAVVAAAMGPVTLLVNNAGVMRENFIAFCGAQEWDEVLSVSLTGTFNCIRSAVPGMAGGGSILNMASVAGIGGDMMKAAYASAKAGVIGLTMSAAREFAPAVRVNALAPGIITTEMTAALTGARRERLLGIIPAGRFGSAQEVAEAAVFLLGADYITGQTLRVCGGLSM